MNRNRSYKKRKKNVRAVNFLKSWIKVAGGTIVPAAPGADLSVTGPSGRADVRVVLEPLEESVEGLLEVPGRLITGKNPQAARAVFFSITDRVGLPRVDPMRAPGEVKENGNIKKLHHSTEEFLIAIRHTEFRRSPNPPEDRWGRYRHVVEQVVRTFLSAIPGSRELCSRAHLEEDDLMNLARCLVVNFVAGYEIEDPVHDDNERVLTTYLQQRFYVDPVSSLLSILRRKERSVMPDYQTAAITMCGDPDGNIERVTDPSEAYAWGLDHRDEVARIRAQLAAGVPLDQIELSLEEPEGREETQPSLADRLAAMPHDDMVGSLNRVIEDHHDYAVKKEALRRLRSHRGQCSTCERLQVAEQGPGPDLGGVLPEVMDLLEAHGA